MNYNTNYHECKVRVMALTNGTLSSYLYAYCKTINCPKIVEPYMLRKVLKFTDLKKHVQENICNDFARWYELNKNTPALLQVAATIINKLEGRTEMYQYTMPVAYSYKPTFTHA